jgi:hypothetical protein
MNKDEVKDLFKRIKSHYSNFDITDDFKFKEWLKYLKDYESSSVNYQLEKWLKSDYGTYEPKVDNLIKWAKKKSETGKPIYVMCQNCKEKMLIDNYEAHIHRENSVDYMTKMAKKHLNKDIDYDKFMTMSEELFDEKYMKLLEAIKDKVDNVEFYGTSTKGIIEKILDAKM